MEFLITKEPDKETLEKWKALWEKQKDVLKPNRKSGKEILSYLESNYPLTEIFDKDALDVVSENVLMNEFSAEKLHGKQPVPKAFYLENSGKGKKFYLTENQDPLSLWGDVVTRIFVGIDITSGFFTVEGSTLLWDELCAFRGVDEADLQNYAATAMYIEAKERIEANGYY